jgi:hypothetical protein
VALVLLLVGCGPEAGITTLRSADLVALVDDDSDSGMEAQVVGEVVPTQGGCLAISDGSGAEAMPVVWPSGTTLDGTVVVLATRDRIAPGDHVTGTGGEIAAESVGDDLPAECEPVDGKILRVHEIAGE